MSYKNDACVFIQAYSLACATQVLLLMQVMLSLRLRIQTLHVRRHISGARIRSNNPVHRRTSPFTSEPLFASKVPALVQHMSLPPSWPPNHATPSKGPLCSSRAAVSINSRTFPGLARVSNPVVI